MRWKKKLDRKKKTQIDHLFSVPSAIANKTVEGEDKNFYSQCYFQLSILLLLKYRRLLQQICLRRISDKILALKIWITKDSVLFIFKCSLYNVICHCLRLLLFCLKKNFEKNHYFRLFGTWFYRPLLDQWLVTSSLLLLSHTLLLLLTEVLIDSEHII